MALGAVGDADLAERVGEAIGARGSRDGRQRRLRPGLRRRHEPGERRARDPLVRRRPGRGRAARGGDGPRAPTAGVAAAPKHFPGLGDAGEDTHHGIALIDAPRDRLEAVELLPFRSGDLRRRGARDVGPCRGAGPVRRARRFRPRCRGRSCTDLLRGELGFDGVSDQRRARHGGARPGRGAVGRHHGRARAGVDLFLCAPDPEALARIEATLVAAAERRLVEADELRGSLARVEALRAWLAAAGPAPDIDIVGSAAHLALAAELAARSITLVRDPAGLLPLRPAAAARILAVMPTPTRPDPGRHLVDGRARTRRRAPGATAHVEELVVPAPPTDADIAAARGRAAARTWSSSGRSMRPASPARPSSSRAVAATGRPSVAVALRTPWDAATYPAQVAVACTIRSSCLARRPRGVALRAGAVARPAACHHAAMSRTR